MACGSILHVALDKKGEVQAELEADFTVPHLASLEAMLQ